MKKHFFITLSLCTALSLCAQNPRVLFIGNSYTSCNDLPDMFANISNSAGHPIFQESNTPGGIKFMEHVANQSMTYLQQGNWDYVILQEQSQYPAFSITQVERDCFPYAARLVDSARKYSECAKIMFYMTWGRKNGDKDNCPNIEAVCTYEGMDDRLYERYMMMGNNNNADVAPVGAVWRYLRTHHLDTIVLYQSDESHPTMAGTYLAACTFYAMIFQENPSLLEDNISVPLATKQIIRDAVKLIVFDSLSKWQMEVNNIVTADFSYRETQNGTFAFENQSVNATHYYWDLGDGTFSNEENPTHTYADGDYDVILTAYRCNDSSTITYRITMTTVGMSTYEPTTNLSCYPNPVRDVLTVEMNGFSEQNGLIQIYSENGQLVWEQNTQLQDKINLNVDFLSSGIYFVKIISGKKEIRSEKFIKI